ncbi:MAG: hypothetical protein P4L95_09230 [Rouxiella aceris]|jgi:hypothetical protein|uniref:hypothetical protein n=1 Tax=Rouxiella aceris TaxID=2703884 RepID=UPI00284A59E6|nr:hypothetical protein [Rouxiella aceris]MDR3432066.1 hypothetical protein [Rouxiella aceris]
MEWIKSGFAYLTALLLTWFSRHSPQDIAFIVGSLVAVGTLVINLVSLFVTWHYKRKTYLLLKARGLSDEVAHEFTR